MTGASPNYTDDLLKADHQMGWVNETQIVSYVRYFTINVVLLWHIKYTWSFCRWHCAVHPRYLKPSKTGKDPMLQQINESIGYTT